MNNSAYHISSLGMQCFGADVKSKQKYYYECEWTVLAGIRGSVMHMSTFITNKSHASEHGALWHCQSTISAAHLPFPSRLVRGCFYGVPFETLISPAARVCFSSWRLSSLGCQAVAGAIAAPFPQRRPSPAHTPALHRRRLKNDPPSSIMDGGDMSRRQGPDSASGSLAGGCLYSDGVLRFLS